MTDIVPEGFDLEKAKAEIVNTVNTETRRCNCGSAGLEPYNGGCYNDYEKKMYYCHDCQKRISIDETYIGTHPNA